MLEVMAGISNYSFRLKLFYTLFKNCLMSLILDKKKEKKNPPCDA